ncbi:hypothetical protein QAD02_014967 [Eretmocerus hayati]|uniref:Uncharacterized protein n=1 Tax=Eretmocerus hayati TaxID=131215 RepID=A0ACC2P6G4_9HYME|nr:hypothetical protein QAD02_014967 [Eretmocerus hayati]
MAETTVNENVCAPNLIGESSKKPHSDKILYQQLGLSSIDTIASIDAGGNGFTFGTSYQTEHKKMVLHGDPQETFSVDQSIKITTTTGNSDGTPENTELLHIIQDINLKFDNYVHEISRKYCYQIRVITETQVGYEETYIGVHTRCDALLHVKDRSYRLFRVKPHSKTVIKKFHLIIHRFNSDLETSLEKECSVGRVLMDDEATSDASVIVGDRVIPVHKCILASKSEVFKAMFAHNMKENLEGIVKIDEFDAEIIEELIKYVYTQKSTRLPEISRELFEAAHKYQIHDLEDKCKEYMIFNLNFDNAIDILDIAFLYNFGTFKKKVFAFIKKHEEEMAKNERYEEYLGRNIQVNNVAYKLKLCEKYNLVILKKKLFHFVREHKKDVAKNANFMDLFKTHASLMGELFTHLAD